jgi:cell division septum initiation protein DivIVA
MPAPVLTSTRYQGKVCEKHPEMLGIRRKANSNCIACHREHAKLLVRRAAAEAKYLPGARRADRNIDWEEYREQKRILEERHRAEREELLRVFSEGTTKFVAPVSDDDEQSKS